MDAPHLRGLNEPQREAVATISGPLLVLAGAGTGKTRVVTCRIAEILSRGIPPKAVCAVTFTNKAAREMKQRAKALLPRRGLDDMVVSTFHSLGLRILREKGSPIGVRRKNNIADEGDQLSITSDALREAGVSRTVIRPKDARWRISGWKNAGLSPERAQEIAEPGLESTLALVYQRYDEELRRQSLLDFDDLILRPLELFAKAPEVLEGLRERWHYLLVDEYQDTNGCQYAIVKELCGPRRNLCVVGDDDQSIYGWRGADPERILRFNRDFPGAKVVTLEQNYRSSGRILDAANVLIASNTRRRKKKLWSASGAGEPVDLYIADDDKDETDFVVSRLCLMRSQEAEQPWEDFAVLFRANSQCRPLEQALRARQIPYSVVGTRSFFDRREVRDILSFLRLARNPDDDSALLRIINTPARGIGKGSVDRILELAAEQRAAAFPTLEASCELLTPRAREGARAFVALIQGVRDRAAESGITEAMSWLVAETAYEAHLRVTVDDPLELQARLKVVEELVDSAREQEVRGAGSLEAFLDSLALREDDRRKDDGQNRVGVTLLTMHAAKGLEYPVVFVVGLEEGLLPHANSLADADDAGEDEKAVEEERRLCYVAITRARERLFLSYARTRTRFGRTADRTPSRFIEELGEETLHVTDSGDETPADPELGREMLRQIRARFAASKSESAD